MRAAGTLLLTRRDVAGLLDLDECIAAVEAAFRRRGEGKVAPAGILGFPADEGGFHIKAAALHPYFAAKINANFFRNRERFGMPNIQGIVLLCDAGNGYPLAVLDSIEITIRRTGAATAVAAKYLAREDARVVAICGCGNQGRIQLAALARVRRLERAYAFDSDPGRAEEFASEMSQQLGIRVEAVPEPGPAVRGSEIAVTCTPSLRPFLGPEDVAPGTFVAAVGSDSTDKQELDPRILASARVVVDSLDQCAEIGELHHAIEAGLMTRADIHAEISDLAAGTRSGRARRDEITIFDSTGTALQDAAAAAVVYEKASRGGKGVLINFAD
ncbi:MAG TPA: ornithine cyclodeaminase family protein [Thermoanaerobaculia bacterium]|nr:ornithine cyclodeaminase family protein [Thermoanaerobaculia bacterium]